MTDLYDRLPGTTPEEDEHSHGALGHNHEHEIVWERWQKERTFVRALKGTYSDLTKALLDQMAHLTPLPLWEREGPS